MSAFLTEAMPKLALESMDGSVSIPLDDTMGWIRMPGSTGLEMAPTDVIAASIPGAPGDVVQDVRILPRPVFLPLYGYSPTSQRDYLGLKDRIRSLINPLNGSFKLVGTSVRAQRELVLTYDGGLEGADGGDRDGLSWCKIGLNATAHDPFAKARADRTLEFRVVSNAVPFLGAVGGTDSPWPTSLSSTAVVGTGMTVTIDSEVPVYPIVELVGNMTSFLGTLSPIVINPDGSTTTITDREWSVDVPLGVPALSTLRMVTDPRQRSVRLDGALAAGRIARGSTVRPFYPGQNTLNVVAPGGTEDTRIILSWREQFWSLW